jgi:hypothetical protein
MLLLSRMKAGNVFATLLSSPCRRTEFHLECGRYE